MLSFPGLAWLGFPGLASLGGAGQVQHVAHEQPAAGHVRAALDRPAVPVGGRRLPGQPGEQRRERAEAAEPDQVADLGHGQVGVAQQVLGPLDPAAAEVPDRGQPVGGLEAAGEVILRHPGHPGEPVQVRAGPRSAGRCGRGPAAGGAATPRPPGRPSLSWPLSEPTAGRRDGAPAEPARRHWCLAGQASGPSCGQPPARSARRMRMKASAVTSSSTEMAAETRNARSKPAASARE